MEYQQQIVDDFPELFSASNNENDTSPRGLFARKHGWFATIMRLADNDATKIEKVTNLNHEVALYSLSYLVELNKIETNEIKQQQNVQRVSR